MFAGSRADVIITLGQSRHTEETDWPGDWPVERPICNDWGDYPGPGVAILRFYDDDAQTEITMECLVAGFDHAQTRMSWGSGFCQARLLRERVLGPSLIMKSMMQSTSGHINPHDRTSLVHDLIVLPQAEVSFSHAMSLVYAFG